MRITEEEMKRFRNTIPGDQASAQEQHQHPNDKIRQFANELVEQRKKETEGNRSDPGRNEIREMISDLRGIITRFRR